MGPLEKFLTTGEMPSEYSFQVEEIEIEKVKDMEEAKNIYLKMVQFFRALEHIVKEGKDFISPIEIREKDFERFVRANAWLTYLNFRQSVLISVMVF